MQMVRSLSFDRNMKVVQLLQEAIVRQHLRPSKLHYPHNTRREVPVVAGRKLHAERVLVELCAPEP